MAAQTSMVHVRIDEVIKAQATDALRAMGLSVSDAIRLFLLRVVADQALPFDLKVPNAKTRSAMSEARAMNAVERGRFSNADQLFAELDKKSGG
jgi:DNA-damage-inducible protein J